MWLMLQHPGPVDFVIATGKTYSVREFVEKAFLKTGTEICWEGKEENEKGKDSKTGKTLVEIDPRYFRPTEVDYLLGDPSRAKKLLGWEAKVSFDELVTIMVHHDLEVAAQEHLLQTKGYKTFNNFE